MGITNKEKVLYHQIHPLKLATDISVSIVSLYLFWHHMLIAGLAIHLLPPVAGSLLIMKYASIETQKSSRLGRYIAKHMGALPQGIRLAGDIVTVLGAWYRSWLLIIIGLIIVLGAWMNGLWTK
jgi:hypothetical protein